MDETLLDLLDTLYHLLNFLAPAACVAVLVALFGHFWRRKAAVRMGLWRAIAMNFIVCAAALLIGLWVFGHDGKMGSYAGLVLAAGTSQWLMARGWRA